MVSVCTVIVATGCSVALVQPYDEKLVDETDAFYKKAALLLSEGQAVSPRTDEERAVISNPSQHPGHFSKFVARYDVLIVDSEALILRAASQSGRAGDLGRRLQSKIGELIDNTSEVKCDAISEDVRKSSLTVANYVDLQCLVIRWRDRHNDTSLTGGKHILKRSNWEGQKLTLFNAVLAIQSAERFKKESK